MSRTAASNARTCAATRGGTRTQYEKTEGHHRADRGHGRPWRGRDPSRGGAALRHRRPRLGPAHHQDRRRAARHAGLPIQIPGITGAIAQIIDNGVIATPTPTPRRPSRPTVPAVPTVPGIKPKPALDADPGRQREARRAEPHPGRLAAGNANGAAAATASSRPATRTARSSSRSSSAGPRRRPRPRSPGRTVDGAPTLDNPTFSLAMPGAAPIGVPNFFIDKFRIPPFLLPIYQAAGIEYGVRWEVLAAINEIETDYGRNLNVSTAGAVGWMQFMPQTWKQYGVDANKDGFKDPVQPARRDLRRRPLPQGRRRRAGPAQGDLRLQPRRLVRRLGPHARPPDRRAALQLRRLAHRADPGPLPRRRQGHLRRRLHRDGREEGQQEVAQPG